MFRNIFWLSEVSKGSKTKLIIFVEFSAKGYPPPHLQKIINFSPIFWMLECQNEGKGEGSGGHFYVFTLLYVLEHSEHFCFCLLFWWEKIYYFHGWGVPPSPPLRGKFFKNN